jgi:simple sugar transport system permease protein
MKRFLNQDKVLDAIVPTTFIVLCIVGVVYSNQPLPFILNSIIERMGRNCFLVVSLLIPVIAGIGLNFSIVVGAMAAQIGYIFAIDWGLGGIAGIGVATAVATPLALGFGYLVGQLFNRAKGREMVTGIITGFFANGIYQMVFLFAAGTLFTIHTAEMLLPRGSDEAGNPIQFGLRNTINLASVQYALDDLIPVPPVGGLVIPLFPFILIALVCIFVVLFKKTKLGQEMKAMGLNQHIAEVSGIHVNKNRVIATILSTVMAAWGQIIFLQNMGTINTYSSHEQVGMFAIAALLVSGASVNKASIWNALFGTLLFHTLFFTSPLAGKNIFGEPHLGEYFRVFIAYGVIGVALAMHTWKTHQKAKKTQVP